MAKPVAPSTLIASVSGNHSRTPAAMAASAALYRKAQKPDPHSDRNQVAKQWQIEAYRHVNICGEARYAATLFAAIAGRAEIGVSEPNALARKAVWVSNGPEVEAFAEIAPSQRERSKLIRDYMLHRTIAGECYLVARERQPTDADYVDPPMNPMTDEPYDTWAQAIQDQPTDIDLMDTDEDGVPEGLVNPNVENSIWEIVAVTDIQKKGDGTWQVRHDNNNWLDLDSDDPVIRMWNPDPENRREAWSPYRSLLPTLQEIEWLTKHIFTQVKARLYSSGVWFLPENLTFPAPPPDSIEGGAEAIAELNEAEQFMLALAYSGTQQLDAEEVSFPTIVMSDEAALASVDQDKLIKFWSEIDDKAMVLRSDAVRRFSLGMDLPPEQVLGSSGLAVTGAGGSAGSVNHWGVWANEEQTISAHIEPALDDFVGVMTSAFLRTAVEGTKLVIAYDTASLRLRQDRSKEAMEWYDRGVLKAEVAVREGGFDPENDIMSPEEHKLWLLNKIVSGQATPEQMQAALVLLGVPLKIEAASESGADGGDDTAPGVPGRNDTPSLDDHPYQGPPREQHDHSDAPFSALAASCEALALRALEKAGNVLVNNRKRGRDQDRTSPKHLAHLTASIEKTYVADDFDFSLAATVLGDLPVGRRTKIERDLGAYCASLYNSGEAYSRDGLTDAVKGL